MTIQFPKGKYLSVVKVGEKGQIVIPKEVRSMFEIRPGDNLLLLADETRGIALVPMDEMMEFDALMDQVKGRDFHECTDR